MSVHSTGRATIGLGDIVRANETMPYYEEWKRTEMKVVGLHLDPDGGLWADVIEGEQPHRGNGTYDGETDGFDVRWLTKVSLPATER